MKPNKLESRHLRVTPNYKSDKHLVGDLSVDSQPYNLLRLESGRYVGTFLAAEQIQVL